MTEKTSVSERPCWWCCEPGILNVGPGYFRDFDSDLSYGIPVCGGCGGIGRCTETPEFKERAKRIMELRFMYCPVGGDTAEPLPVCVIRIRLENLIASVSDLYRDFGREEDESLAKKIAKGALKHRVAAYREAEGREAMKYREALKSCMEPDRAAVMESLALAAEGKLDEAERSFQEAIVRYPQSSYPQHDFGGFLLSYRRDLDSALAHILRSTELQPQKALHYWQAAGMYGRKNEVRRAFELAVKMRHCPDYDSVPHEIKTAVREYIMQYS